MAYSICVSKAYETDDGERHRRFGVGVTTRLPGVGTLCPFVSERAAVATRSLVNVERGARAIDYVDDGAPQRQVHGVDSETTEDHDLEPPYNDLRIDATETSIADLRETDELAERGYRDTLAQYEGAFEADSLEEAAD
ncbi:DUF1028 domain-containing protein [Natrinema soli]|uniref:DUF1028 domain-containing protein n=1 Tax=Natrinema soli TaxID=1930624 RepID=A0ABD5STU1_9EURY|nr:DUF1028 domain-containing protein [Natrinema soli]